MLMGSKNYWKFFEIELRNGDQEMGWMVQVAILNRVVLGRLMGKETFEFNTQFPYDSFLCPSLFLPPAKFCLYTCCLSPWQHTGEPRHLVVLSCLQNWLHNLQGPTQKENQCPLFKNHYRFQVSNSRVLSQVQGPSAQITLTWHGWP